MSDTTTAEVIDTTEAEAVVTEAVDTTEATDEETEVDISVNLIQLSGTAPVALPAGSTAADLLDVVGLSAKNGTVLVNSTPAGLDQVLQPGDQVVFATSIKGGRPPTQLLKLGSNKNNPRHYPRGLLSTLVISPSPGVKYAHPAEAGNPAISSEVGRVHVAI
jgi:sulfur carrier protein ThiS